METTRSGAPEARPAPRENAGETFATREAAIRQAIAHSCMLLDEERFSEWLDYCADAFNYSIEAYSTEIRRTMTWLDLGREALRDLFNNLKLHERDSGALLRHVSEPFFHPLENGDVQATTSILIVRTALDGTSRLLAAGRYHDCWSHRRDRPLLASRRVVLSTRVLMSDAGGSHVPF